MKKRLDLLLVERGLAESREKAQRLLLAGEVLVDDAPAPKPGHLVPVDAAIRIRHPLPFVSRGGLKLAAAFEHFPSFVVDRLPCADIGASTGGFTDCLLQHGAARVYAIDVGTSLLHPKIAADPRVVVIDRFNARNLQPSSLPEPVSIAVTDVSFISLRIILPAIHRILAPSAHVVALIKPQFEAGREDVGKGGVVRDPAVHARVVSSILDFVAQSLPEWSLADPVAQSPVRGPAGNIEFLAHFLRS